jgi:hypothetical protein
MKQPMRIGQHFTGGTPMTKKILKAALAVELAKQLAKAKNTQTDKLRTVQLPVQAHTSGNAKLAIAVSLITSGLALSAVVFTAIRAAQKEADRRGEELFNTSFPSTNDVKQKVSDVVADAKEAVADVKEKVAEAPVVKKVTRTAKKQADTAEDKAAEAKDAVEELGTDMKIKPSKDSSSTPTLPQPAREAAETVAEKTERVAKAAREAKETQS